MRWYPLINRAGGGSGDGPGDIDARFTVTPAFAFSTVMAFIHRSIKAGIDVALAPIRSTVGQAVGVRFSTANTLAPFMPSVRPGMRLSGRNAGTVKPAHRPALNIVQTKVDLIGRYGADAASATSARWSNPSNATGPRDDIDAVCNADALSAGTSSLTLDYPALTGKTSLAISSAVLHSFWSLANVVGANATAVLEYSLDGGGSWATLATRTAVFDHKSGAGAPEVFDVTSAVGGDWAKLNLLRTRYSLTWGLGSAARLSVDCCLLVVNASRTEMN